MIDLGCSLFRQILAHVKKKTTYRGGPKTFFVWTNQTITTHSSRSGQEVNFSRTYLLGILDSLWCFLIFSKWFFDFPNLGNLLGLIMTHPFFGCPSNGKCAPGIWWAAWSVFASPPSQVSCNSFTLRSGSCRSCRIYDPVAWWWFTEAFLKIVYPCKKKRRAIICIKVGDFILFFCFFSPCLVACKWISNYRHMYLIGVGRN